MVSPTRGRSAATILRGEIWLAVLDPTVGSEIRKTRPCLIVSPPEMNDRLRTIMAVPLTSGSRPAPSRVPVSFQGRAGLILLDQLRTLDKARLIRRLGVVETAILRVALATLREIFEE